MEKLKSIIMAIVFMAALLLFGSKEPIVANATESETIEPFDVTGIEPIYISDSPMLAHPCCIVPDAPPVVEIVASGPSTSVTAEERQMLAQLVRSEVGNQSLYVKRLAVDVVLNRRDSPKWPSTIEGVIFQRHQFTVMSNGSFRRAAAHLTAEDWQAVDLELAERLDYGIQYFNDNSLGRCANGRNGWCAGYMWFAY